MTAFKYLALSGLICGLLAPSAFAAPIASTSGEWWWWLPAYASSATSNSSPDQYAQYTNSLSDPSATSASGTAPVFLSNYVPDIPAAGLAPTPATSLVADANLNLGSGPYSLESTITTGNAQPWYNSAKSLASLAVNRALSRWPASTTLSCSGSSRHSSKAEFQSR